MTDYDTVKLIELVTFRTGKLDSNAAKSDGEYPFFTCAPETLRIDNFAFDTTAILLAGNNATGVFPVKYYSGKFNCYQRTYVIENRNENRSFLPYIYFAIQMQLKLLQNMSIGAATKFLTRGILDNLQVLIPPLPTQKKIAGVLSAYDDMIETNLKRIKLLEEMAQITYEEWFMRLHFPKHETIPTNPESGLPEGWKTGSLSQIIIKLESGTRPKGGIDRNQTSGVPSVGAENVIGIGKYNYGAEKLVSEDFFFKMRRGKVSQKDVLIYKDGAYIGKTSMFQDGFPYKICAVNEHVFLINSENEFWQNFLYFTLSKKEYYLKMQGLNSGAAQPGINQEKLKGLDLLLPSDEIISSFNERVEPIVKTIFALAKQNRLLKEARDLLLPRLMTGLIDIDDYLARNASPMVAA